MDLSLYIYEILEPLGIETLYLIRPKSFPCISYHLFDESGELYGDGDIRVTNGSLQIDLFTKKSSELRLLRKKIIEAFKISEEIIFIKSTPDESSYENDVQLYHQVIVFRFSYSQESEVI